jgi:hypothetical protein
MINWRVGCSYCWAASTLCSFQLVCCPAVCLILWLAEFLLTVGTWKLRLCQIVFLPGALCRLLVQAGVLNKGCRGVLALLSIPMQHGLQVFNRPTVVV